MAGGEDASSSSGLLSPRQHEVGGADEEVMQEGVSARLFRVQWPVEASAVRRSSSFRWAFAGAIAVSSVVLACVLVFAGGGSSAAAAAATSAMARSDAGSSGEPSSFREEGLESWIGLAEDEVDGSKLGKGWKVWVTSQTGHKRICTVIDSDSLRVKIHYDGFPEAFDEWLKRDSSRFISYGKTSSTTGTTTTRTVTITQTVTTTTATTTTLTTTTATTTSTTVTTTSSTTTTTPRKYASLYCFTLARSDNSELDILRLQIEKSMGIFDCDSQDVFSDVTTWLSQGPTFLQSQSDQQMLIETKKVPAKLSDAKHANWLNARDYMECWKAIVAEGRFKWHDWTVKVDPDTVFLPSRLREHLRTAQVGADVAAYFHTCKWAPRKCIHTVTMGRTYGSDWGFTVIGTSKDQFSVSSTCNDESPHASVCKKHNWGSGVHDIVDQDGHKVSEGNCCNEVETVKSVQSDCPQQQTESPETGLSGALEVISKKAVELYQQNSQRCWSNGYGDVGEEFFMQECLELLGARPMPGTDLLSDTFCGGHPGKCGTSEVAFHPFKTKEDFMECMGAAFLNYKVAELHPDLLHAQTADG